MAEAAQDYTAHRDEKPLVEALRTIIGRLEKEAEDRVGKRRQVEDRWLTDLRQYHGNYEDKILKELAQAKKSSLFINQTRPKTNACAARLSDMLFPTDDKNYGILPTPVPELSIEAEEAARAAAEAKIQLADNPDDPEFAARAAEADRMAGLINARLDEAKKRARAMEEEIDDHLRECKYSIQGRVVIEDGTRLGTGIMKGPVTDGSARRSWQEEDGGHVLRMVDDRRPAYWRVNPWNWFPDMDASTVEDCESFYERHLLNRKQLRKLARQPGFDQDAIRRLLKEGPTDSLPYYIADLRTITGAYHDTGTDRYHVWEYHGPLTVDDMRLLAAATDPDLLKDAGVGDDVDPLDEMEVVVWFCQGELLKFGIHQLDSGEPIYSVFCLEKDEACVFGFGIPYLMRDSQKALSAGWRLLMDNAGLASGPQVVVNPEVVEPVDGDWTLTPRKVWRRKKGAAPGEVAFDVHNIDMHQAELANIIEMAKQNIDDETNIPVIAQGEQGSHVTQTAHGMSILMNSVNVVFRRIVKNWDDDMTTPSIRRLYDWLMQQSPKEHIKGDYQVDARGTSVLLVKEMQSANLMQFLSAFAGHPVVGRFLKKDGLPALRRLSQTLMIPADDVIKSDQEIAEDEAAAAEAPPQPDPEILKIEAMLNTTMMNNDHRREIELIKRETALITLAATHNMELDKLKAHLLEGRAERDSKERIFAAEIAAEERKDRRGDDSGSGGYV